MHYSPSNNDEAAGMFDSPATEEYSNDHEMVLTREEYMVLYNGNAEVVGNFRALNFYKASDINIKEDVRLLMEGKCDKLRKGRPPRSLTLFYRSRST
jgi:hypothetical protein